MFSHRCAGYLNVDSIAAVAEDGAEALDAAAADAESGGSDDEVEPATGGGGGPFTQFKGELQARSMVLKQWKRGAFVLTAESLSAEKSGRVSLVFERASIHHVEVVRSRSTAAAAHGGELRFTLQIDSLRDDRAAVYRAATAEVLALWVAALRAAEWPVELEKRTKQLSDEVGDAAEGDDRTFANPMQMQRSRAVIDGASGDESGGGAKDGGEEDLEEHVAAAATTVNPMLNISL